MAGRGRGVATIDEWKDGRGRGVATISINGWSWSWCGHNANGRMGVVAV